MVATPVIERALLLLCILSSRASKGAVFVNGFLVARLFPVDFGAQTTLVFDNSTEAREPLTWDGALEDFCCPMMRNLQKGWNLLL